MTFEIVSVETKYEGWGRYLALCVRLPNGEVVRREIEDHGRAVAVLAYDPQRRTAIFVRQFRAPVFYSLRQEHTLEVIAGLEEDADTATTARREAIEEAGLRRRIRRQGDDRHAAFAAAQLGRGVLFVDGGNRHGLLRQRRPRIERDAVPRGRDLAAAPPGGQARRRQGPMRGRLVVWTCHPRDVATRPLVIPAAVD